MQSLFSLITAAVFFTAAFFTGRQAAVLTGKFRVEREQSRQSRTKYCVVVDAGHGGDDPGKIGTAGTLEKEINLAIAKRLEALLKQADVAVVMTRTDNNGLYDENASGKKVQDMKRRVSMMEEAKAERLVGGLVDWFRAHPDSLSQEALSRREQGDSLDTIICDYVSGMSDNYAVRCFQKFYVPKAWDVY